jgi:hypothetical protein
MQEDLRNTLNFRKFITTYSFVYTIIEIAKLPTEVLGQLAQQSLVL